MRDFEREIHPDYVKDPNHEAYKEMIDQIVTYTEIYGGTDENKEALYRTAFNEPIFVTDEKVDPLTEGAYSVDPINGWLNERPLKSDLRKLSEAAEKYCTAKNGEGLTKGTKLTPYYESMGPLEITQTFRVKKGQWDTVEKHFRNLELYFRAASLQDKGMISWEHNQDPLTQRYVITSYFKNRKAYDLFMKLQSDYPFVDDTVAVQNGTQLLHTRYVASSWDVFCNFTIAPKKTIYLGKPIFAREP